MRALGFAVLSLLLANMAVASSAVVEFSDESLRIRYQQLVQELRCPKCQNQNLADSNSPISEDLRAQVHRLLEQGMS
jgi:cytochrome c-type biogenesis protein CcmH